MDARKKLFRFKRPYDICGTQELFVRAMRENALYQYAHCSDYRRILDEAGFHPQELQRTEDLSRLPFLPTLYFKHHKLFSMPEKKMLIRATSSGTSGSKSEIGFDAVSLIRALDMVIRVGKYHHLWSLKPVHYIIFGFEPSRSNHTVISKTAYGSTFFAPAFSRTFVLKKTKNGYRTDMDGAKQKLIKCAKSKIPMRTIGFPAYTYFLLREMQEEGIRLKMPEGSLVTLGGGWKQFYTRKVEKKELYALIKEVLGVEENHVIEFFGAVEHMILYADCRCHHFHIPVYSRVLIRDPDTLQPVPDGQPGLINLMSPMVKSMPILSIMTDDLGILHTEGCGCGESSPWLEIIGRVGIKDIITCAAGAAQALKE